MRLKELRTEKNLTQTSVANAIHTSQRNIGRWENNEVLPTADFIIRLAEFFNVSTDYLLGLEDDFGGRVAQKETPQLTAEERKLLEDYRELSAPGKQLVQTTVKTLLDGSSVKRNSEKPTN